MGFCVECGEPLEEGAQFCTSCGAQVAPAAAETQALPRQSAQPTRPVVPDDFAAQVTQAAAAAAGRAAGAHQPQPTIIEQTAPFPQAQQQWQQPASFPQGAQAQQPYYPQQGQGQGFAGGGGQGGDGFGWQAPAAAAPAAAPAKGGGKPGKGLWIGAIAAVVVAALAIFVFVTRPAFIFGGGESASTTEMQQVATVPEGGQDAAGTDAAADGSASSSPAEPITATNESAGKTTAQPGATSASQIDEQGIYAELSGMYAQLGAFDTRIADVATDFNDHNSDKFSVSTRQGYLADAQRLQDEISAFNTQVLSLEVPTASVNHGSYEKVVTCAYDCQRRISVIVEAWQRSVQYTYPNDHTEYIIEPLSRDVENNHNKYKTEFDNVYPTAAPVAP